MVKTFSILIQNLSLGEGLYKIKALKVKPKLVRYFINCGGRGFRRHFIIRIS